MSVRVFAAAAWPLLLLGACDVSSGPQLTAVQPRSVPFGVDSYVRVVGHNLQHSVSLSLDDFRSPSVSSAWGVAIGNVPLSAQRIELVDSRTLALLVPGDLDLGSHDIHVTTPAGLSLRLSPGLTVEDAVRPPPSVDSGTLTPPGSASDAGQILADAGPPASDAGGLAPDASDAAGAPVDGGGAPVDASPPAPTVLRAALTHRYSFEGSGAAVVDSVGAADGTFIGGVLDGVSGVAQLSGSGQYVDLPNALILGYDAVTIEAWIIWEGPEQGAGSGWQRIFDFGNSNAAEGSQGDGIVTHLFATPRAGGAAGTLHFEVRGTATGTFSINGVAPLPTAEVQHVTVSVDGVAHQMALFLNGLEVESLPFDHELSSVVYENNWIGRSQQLDDPDFQGQILEFRIYDQALDAAAVALSHAAGPDAAL